MATWYEISKYIDKVHTVEVVKATAKQIVVREYDDFKKKCREVKRLKKSEWNTYFSTELEAWIYLRKRTQLKYDQARNDMLGAECSLDEIHKKIAALS